MSDTMLTVVGDDLEVMQGYFTDDDERLGKEGIKLLQTLPVIAGAKDSTQVSIRLGEEVLYSGKEVFISIIDVFNLNILFIKGKDENNQDIDIRACTTGFIKDEEPVGGFYLNQNTSQYAPFEDDHPNGSVVYQSCKSCCWSKTDTKKDIGQDGQGRACGSRKVYLVAVCNLEEDRNGLKLFKPAFLAVLSLPMGSNWKFPGELSKALNLVKKSIVNAIPNRACVVKLTNKVAGDRFKYSEMQVSHGGVLKFISNKQFIDDSIELAQQLLEENRKAPEQVNNTEEDDSIPF
jgi:hypothetical protein